MLLTTMKKSKKLVLGVAVGVAVSIGLGAGTAFALSTISTGTFSDRQYFATNDTAYVVPAATPSGTWVNVPGMSRTIVVPTNERRLIDARFTTETSCSGGSWCSARIVYVTSAGATVELFPQAGTDFALDSPATDNWEGHAIERNTRDFLPAGTYRIQVQAAKVGNPTFRLDDMHLAVEAIRP